MKTYLALSLFCFCSFSCANRASESLPLADSPGQQWTIFEGKIISDEGENIEVELSLRESSPGLPSQYLINGLVVTDTYTGGWQSGGQYEVERLEDNLFGITLLGVKTGHPVSSDRFFTRNIDRMRNLPLKSNNYTSADFYFITNGDGQLTLTDGNFKPVANDNRYTIVRRSNLFTVEGYVTVEPDSSLEFFERNTFEKWHVADLGMYDLVKDTYADLAKEPWEGIYIRALAYSVADTADDSGMRNNLVMKKLITMGDPR